MLLALAIHVRFTSAFFGLYFLLAAVATLAPDFLWCWHRFGDPFHPMVIARRIVTEWTAPVALDGYLGAIPTIFPAAVQLLLVPGLAALPAPAPPSTGHGKGHPDRRLA